MIFRKVLTFPTGDSFELFIDLFLVQKANAKSKTTNKWTARAYVGMAYGDVFCTCAWQDTEKMALNGCYKEARKLLAAQVRAKLQGKQPKETEKDAT